MKEETVVGPTDIYTDGRYLRLNESWHVEDSPWKASQIARALKRNGLQPRRVCDVGCGAGEVLAQLHHLLPQECRFVGYEVSPQAFEMCRQREADRLEFRRGDVRDDGCAEAYDLLLLIDLMEHIEDCWTFLRDIRGHAEHMLLHIPLELSVQKLLRPGSLRRSRKQLGHLHFFTRETALALLEDCEYEVVDWFYTASMIEAPCRTWGRRLARLPRRVAFALTRDWTVRVLGGYSLMVLVR